MVCVAPKRASCGNYTISVMFVLPFLRAPLIQSVLELQGSARKSCSSSAALLAVVPGEVVQVSREGHRRSRCGPHGRRRMPAAHDATASCRVRRAAAQARALRSRVAATSCAIKRRSRRSSSSKRFAQDIQRLDQHRPVACGAERDANELGATCVVANASPVTTPRPRLCSCAAKRALGQVSGNVSHR